LDWKRRKGRKIAGDMDSIGNQHGVTHNFPKEQEIFFRKDRDDAGFDWKKKLGRKKREPFTNVGSEAKVRSPAVFCGQGKV